MTQKTNGSIVKGVSVLSIAGLFCKILGLLITVPLTKIIGAEGLGIFQSVFPTYNLLLTLSSAGLPVAISRMVSHFLAKDDPKNAKHTFKTALYLLTILGCCGTILMIVGKDSLAAWVKEPRSSSGFVAIAPCLMLVCALSALRGFMQGQQNMKPTAISQIVEQVAKLIFALPLAYFGSKIDIAMGATGALLGITISEVCAIIVMSILYFRKKKTFSAIPQLSDEYELSNKSIIRKLILISIPITISACIVPLAQFVDSVMMVPRMMNAGLTNELARSLYGVFSGLVIRLINVPTALALAVSMSIVPAVSAAKAVNNENSLHKTCDQGIRLAFIIGFPCSIGMSVLAKEVFGFLYYESLAEEMFQVGWELLTVSSLTIVLFTAVQATSAILQGLGKQKIPMYTLIAGVSCKIIMNYILIGIPNINIHGGPYASIICYTVSLIPNLYYVCKYANISFDFKDWILKPAVSAAIMGLTVYLFKKIVPYNRITTIILILTGVLVYFFCAWKIGAIQDSDIAAFKRLGKSRRSS